MIVGDAEDKHLFTFGSKGSGHQGCFGKPCYIWFRCPWPHMYVTDGGRNEEGTFKTNTRPRIPQPTLLLLAMDKLLITSLFYCNTVLHGVQFVWRTSPRSGLEDGFGGCFFSHTTLVPPPPAWIRISASAFGHAVEIIHCWGAAVARAAEFPPSRALLDAQLCWLVLSPPRHNTAGDTSRGRGGRTESKAACSYTTTWHTLDATLYCMPTTNFVI